MCINFAPTTKADWLANHFGVAGPETYPLETYPGFVAPLLVKSHQTGRLACGLARFGLIPPWAQDDKISRHTYNARSETAADKPSFRQAWQKRQFGLIPIDHFYEPHYQTGRSVRWKIQRADGAPTALACLWERWIEPQSAAVVVSFALLTVNSDDHSVMKQFHRAQDEKRSPLVVDENHYHAWLEADQQQARQMLDAHLMPVLQAMPAPLAERTR